MAEQLIQFTLKVTSLLQVWSTAQYAWRAIDVMGVQLIITIHTLSNKFVTSMKIKVTVGKEILQSYNYNNYFRFQIDLCDEY